MGIYDGVEEKVKKQRDEWAEQDKVKKSKELLVSEYKDKMYPLVVEGIDGFVEMALKVGKAQRIYKKDILFLTDMISFKVWDIYIDSTISYGITRSGKIYKTNTGIGVPRMPYTGVERASKKELAEKMVGIILSREHINTNQTKIEVLQSWDYEAAVKKYFTELFVR